MSTLGFTSQELGASLHPLDLIFRHYDQCKLHYHQSASTDQVLDRCAPHLRTLLPLKLQQEDAQGV